MEMAADLVLKLHSPAGAEPDIYKWPLTSGCGSVSCVVSFVNYLHCPVLY